MTSPQRSHPDVDAIVLAGGRARRLGGIDKAAVELGGAPLLTHALAAAAGVRACVVVGPGDGLPEDMLTAREEPPYGGPVAALAAGLTALPEPAAPRVLVLACDMPFAAEAVEDVIAASASGARDAAPDGAWAMDAQGRHQPLLAVYRRASLENALAGLGAVAGAAMRALTADLDMVTVAVGRAARDADTWEDVRTLGEEWP